MFYGVYSIVTLWQSKLFICNWGIEKMFILMDNLPILLRKGWERA